MNKEKEIKEILNVVARMFKSDKYTEEEFVQNGLNDVAEFCKNKDINLEEVKKMIESIVSSSKANELLNELKNKNIDEEKVKEIVESPETKILADKIFDCDMRNSRSRKE